MSIEAASNIEFGNKKLQDETIIGGSGGFDPAYTITVTLNGNAPNNWAPTGLTAETQAIIIIGNNKKVDIKNLDRSLMTNGKAILIINAKNGNAEVKIKKNNGGNASNRFLMDKDFKLKPGGAMNFISLDVLDRWGIQFGKF